MTLVSKPRVRSLAVDACRNPAADVRVAVEAWLATTPIDGQFIVRPKSPRMVLNYAVRVGPQAVWRKIRSRLAEHRRNRKVAGIGIGRMLEAPPGCIAGAGDRVIFFAPSHSDEWPRIVLDQRLVRLLRGFGAGPPDVAREALASLEGSVGWSPFSGAPLDYSAVQAALSRAASETAAWSGEARRLPDCASTATPDACERLARMSGSDGRPSAVVFGLGNYAKTQIVPNIRRHLDLAAVHEIDPDQLEGAARLGAALDTSPVPRTSERYDAWFIAGYHHTHAPLAIEALGQGAYAVVEKPLATTQQQFAGLEQTLNAVSTTRLFACFQKRYSRLNEWVRTDLAAASAGEPIDMHCVVYEIPLPRLHWYNWPNSGSRIVSNGCHWLDYFMFLNDYTPAIDASVHPLGGRNLLASVHLANGANLVISLTDRGSERLGMRELIDLRAGSVTVRIIDATYYESETSCRVLRRRRVNPMDAYRRMYDTIARSIVAGSGGDSLASLRSTALMLDLETLYQSELGRRSNRRGIRSSTSAGAAQ